MGAKANVVASIDASEVIAAGANLKAEASFSAGRISHTSQWKNGAGTADKEIAKVLYQKYTGATGVQTINLGNYISPGGKTAQAMTAIKGVYVKSNAQNGTPTGKIGGGTNPIPIFDDPTDVVTLQAGGFFLWEKPFGPGVTLGANINLKIDLGLTAHDAEVLVVGY